MNHLNICAAHESAIANLRLLESEYGAAFSSDIIDHIERAISDIETASHMGERMEAGLYEKKETIKGLQIELSQIQPQ